MSEMGVGTKKPGEAELALGSASGSLTRRQPEQTDPEQCKSMRTQQREGRFGSFAQALASCLKVRIFQGRCSIRLVVTPSTLKPQAGEMQVLGCRAEPLLSLFRQPQAPRDAQRLDFQVLSSWISPELGFGTAKSGQEATAVNIGLILTQRGMGATTLPEGKGEQTQRVRLIFLLPFFFLYFLFLFECRELKMHNLDRLGFL